MVFVKDPLSKKGLLHKDLFTALAMGALAFGFLLPTVGLISIFIDAPQTEARSNPLYWGLMLPALLWFGALLEYSPRALRTVRPGLFTLPFLAGAVLAFAASRDLSMTQYWVMLGLTCAAVLAGGIAYDRSLLAREGPGD